MTVIPTATTTTPDGRTLAYCGWGDPDGAPVLSLHGTPGSRLTRHPDEEVYRRAGVRAITYDRAGCGRSTRLPGRAVAHAAAQVATIADALGTGRFAVMGGSGGRPALAGLCRPAERPRHALRRHREPRPYGPEGLERDAWLSGMVEGNVREFEWSLAGEDTLRPELERAVRELLSKIGTDQENPLGEGYELAQSDIEVIARWGIR